MEIVNYRIERVTNGIVLHVTRGKDGPVEKFIFSDKRALFAWLEDKL